VEKKELLVTGVGEGRLVQPRKGGGVISQNENWNGEGLGANTLHLTSEERGGVKAKKKKRGTPP